MIYKILIALTFYLILVGTVAGESIVIENANSTSTFGLQRPSFEVSNANRIVVERAESILDIDLYPLIMGLSAPSISRIVVERAESVSNIDLTAPPFIPTISTNVYFKDVPLVEDGVVKFEIVIGEDAPGRTADTATANVIRDALAKDFGVTNILLKQDNEITPADKANYNLILIGGPVANVLTADLMVDELSKVDWYNTDGGIEVISDAFTTGKTAIIVAGKTRSKTRKIAIGFAEEISSSVRAQLSITSVPSDAGVYIDGEYQGVTPLQLVVEKGRYEIKISKEGYEDSIEKVDLTAGGERVIDAGLNEVVVIQSAGEGTRGIDSDGDGLTDKEERALKTNPYNADTDGDGIIDSGDVNPLVPEKNKGVIIGVIIPKIKGLLFDVLKALLVPKKKESGTRPPLVLAIIIGAAIGIIIWKAELRISDYRERKRLERKRIERKKAKIIAMIEEVVEEGEKR